MAKECDCSRKLLLDWRTTKLKQDIDIRVVLSETSATKTVRNRANMFGNLRTPTSNFQSNGPYYRSANLTVTFQNDAI